MLKRIIPFDSMLNRLLQFFHFVRFFYGTGWDDDDEVCLQIDMLESTTPPYNEAVKLNFTLLNYFHRSMFFPR